MATHNYHMTRVREKSGYRYFSRDKIKPKERVFKKPRRSEVAGDIPLCWVEDSKVVFHLLLNEFPKNILKFGSAGSGKTNIDRVIEIGFYNAGIPFLAFDLSKYNQRYLKKYIPELLILRWYAEFFINFLKPPSGTRIKNWQLIFCEVFCEAFGLLEASKAVLNKCLNELYEKFNSEESGKFPTIFDLIKLMENQANSLTSKQRVYFDYYHRVLNKLNSICLTLDEQINVQEGIPIDEILKHPACIELVGINMSEVQIWIVSMIMAWISIFRLNNSTFGELKHVIFFDEASNLFSKSKTQNNETFLVRLTRIMREGGECLIYSDQSIASINDVVKSNTYTLICLNQSGLHDMNESSKMLRLSKEQDEIINKLEPGQGIVKLAGRYPHPIFAKFPYVEPQYISEEELIQMNLHDGRIRDLLSRVVPVEEPEKQKTEAKTKKEENDETRLKSVSWVVYQYQYELTKTEICKLAKITGGTMTTIINKCEKNHLIKIINLDFIRGEFPILTDEGYEYIGEKKRMFSGKGGHEHILAQHQIAKKHSQLKPKIEMYRGDKAVDVGIETNEFFIGIEIEMTSAHTKENIEKDFKQAKVDYLVIACLNKKVKKEVKEILSEFPDEIQKKTEVCLIKEVIKRETKNLLIFFDKEILV